MVETVNLGEILSDLYDVIESRKGADLETSYAAALFASGPVRCAKKFAEEAVEAALAGAVGDKKALAEETADMLFHLLVLMAANGVAPQDVAAALAARQGRSGHGEKASRPQ